MANKKSYIELIGNSAVDVTGSCYLVKFKDYNILLECGGTQTNNMVNDYKANIDLLKRIKAKKIDYIFITHAHSDHIMLIPALYKNGCQAPIVCPKGNKEFLEIMWADSVKIMGSDCEVMKKKHRIKARPFYGKEELDIAMDKIIEFDMMVDHKLTEDIGFKYYSANHIENSGQLLLELKDDTLIKRIAYVGDIGNTKTDKHYIRNFDKIDRHLDVILGEATYCTDNRINSPQDRKKDIEKIKTMVDEVMQTHGKIVLPIFSLSRLQTVLTTLYENFHDDKSFMIDIIVDAPLGIKISNKFQNNITKDKELWEKVEGWDRIKWIADFDETIAFQKADKSLLVLSSGGMCQAGRSIPWAKAVMEDSKNYICFCGYTGVGTTGWKIKNPRENPIIKIDGKTFKNRAKVTALNSFSSHADKKELLEYYSEIKYNKIVIIHSDMDGRIEFAEQLRKKLSEVERSSRVVTGNKDMKINF